MSILVDSVYTSSVKLSTSSQTVLSRHFASSHFPSHVSSLYAFTINGGPHGPFTTVLDCSVSSSSLADVSLGLDWKASMREWFIGLGLSPTHGFELENLRAIPRVSAEATVGDGPSVSPPSSVVLYALSAPPSPFPAAPPSSAPKHGMSFAALRAVATSIGAASSTSSHSVLPGMYAHPSPYSATDMPHCGSIIYPLQNVITGDLYFL
ncbi:hypothetical protein MVEN_01099000 [Mycena venus]|uniref:Uncharacterized protein n=1 Tax=Mycena venus TaxID=2733690 RepID=A0A8H7CZY2_9AGAR|nr:hypothetical protein MVEN_01099000 [Mycena venus]